MDSSLRGDAPKITRTVTEIEMVPPCARGCSSLQHFARIWPNCSSPRVDVPPAEPTGPTGARFIPTRVDVSLPGLGDHAIVRAPPRARGCSSYVALQQGWQKSSSPRAWMFSRVRFRRLWARRFLPARVDVPCGQKRPRSQPQVPPRARGCSSRSPCHHAAPPSSSPRAWMFPTAIRLGTSA